MSDKTCLYVLDKSRDKEQRTTSNAHAQRSSIVSSLIHVTLGYHPTRSQSSLLDAGMEGDKRA